MVLTLFLGYFAGFLTTVSLVPQVIKMWTTKSADGFSLAMLLIWCTGISCWVVYGVLLNVVPNYFMECKHSPSGNCYPGNEIKIYKVGIRIN